MAEFKLSFTADEINEKLGIVNNSFIEKEIIGNNRFNPEAVTSGVYVNPNNGSLATNASYSTSDYIPVKTGEVITYQYGTLTVTTGRTIGTMVFIAAYNENKEYVSGDRNISKYSVPDGVAYIRFSATGLSTNNNQSVVASADKKDYESYEIKTVTVLKSENYDDDHIRDVLDIGLEDLFTSKEILGNNRLNSSKITRGYYINPNDGNLAANASYSTSDYVVVNTGETITFQSGGTTAADRSINSINFIVAFDKNKTFLLGSRDVTTYQVPEGAAYIRISNTTMTSGSNLAVVASASVVDYEAYSSKIVRILTPGNYDEEYVKEIAGTVDGGSTDITSLPNIVITNAYDKDATGYQSDKFLWNGSTSDNSSYFATGFFAVEPDTDYALFGSDTNPVVRSVCEYDENQGFISGMSHGNVTTIHTTANTRFLRVSCYNGAQKSLTVKKGTIATGYTPSNSYKIPGEMVAQDIGAIDAYLPKHIYCAVGRTIELYNNQVCLQADKYHMKWHCSVGKALKRKFSITGTEALVGDYTLKLGVYNDRLEEVWAGITTLHIISNTMLETHSICPIGDSLTNAKAWLPEVVNLSDGKISFIGTYSWGLKDADGDTRTGGHEGRSGFTAQAYINGATYSYGGESTPNVFWDGEKFSWSNYKTVSGLNPDAVQIFLGTNGISNDNTENAGYIKQMVDAIRADDVNIPILVCNTLYRSNQNGIGVQVGNDGYAAASGVWKYNEDKKVMDLMKRLDALLDGYEKVYMVNLALTHDSEYNYGNVETSVNPRAIQKEFLPIESVHPQTQGYYQMADTMFSAACVAFNAAE